MNQDEQRILTFSNYPQKQITILFLNLNINQRKRFMNFGYNTVKPHRSNFSGLNNTRQIYQQYLLPTNQNSGSRKRVFQKFESTPSEEIKNAKKKIVISSTKNVNQASRKKTNNQSNNRDNYQTHNPYHSSQEILYKSHIYGSDKQNVKYSINRIRNNSVKDSNSFKKINYVAEEDEQMSEDPFYLETSRNHSLQQITESPQKIQKKFDLKQIANSYINQIKNIRIGINVLNKVLYKFGFQRLMNNGIVCDLSSIKIKKDFDNINSQFFETQKFKPMVCKIIKIIGLVIYRQGLGNIKRRATQQNHMEIYKAVQIIKERQRQLTFASKKLGIQNLVFCLKKKLYYTANPFLALFSKSIHNDNPLASKRSKKLFIEYFEPIATPNFHSKSYSFSKQSEQ